jgi:DegV family protein with EDD domain
MATESGGLMSEIAIITDTLASIPPDLLKKYDIETALQILIWGEETLLDGVDITAQQFYERLATSDVIPTTSQATAGSFVKLFEPHVAKGTPILAIVVSDELSGTIQSAQTAKSEFPDATIEIVDSKAVSMAQGYQVLAAARAAAEGKSFDEVVKLARRAVNSVGVLFVVDTLEFLHRGGRIGGAKKLLGTALSLKPVLQLQNGAVEPLENVRTKSKAKARIVDLVEERLRGKDKIRLAALHANAEDEAAELLESMQQRCDAVETHMTLVSPVIGTHAGPGTVGLAYSFGL